MVARACEPDPPRFWLLQSRGKGARARRLGRGMEADSRAPAVSGIAWAGVIPSAPAIGKEETMPRYLIERTVGQLTPEQIETGSRRSIEVVAGMPGVVWIRSYVSDIDGKIYCEYEAPNAEAIREHARRAGLPVDRIVEISLEISPAMFR